ncbi:MAG TPA: septum site-determining protein MinC [Gammaproteobacteria bacterium]|nr:septum site-determining protein MinC [Gammaproteobacteria bacterium]
MAISNSNKTAHAALDLKGRMITLTVLRLRETATDIILSQLDARLASAPGMFAGMPVVIDFAALDDAPPDEGFRDLVAGLRERELVPVGVLGAEHAGLAQAAGIGVIAGNATAASSADTAPPTEAPRPPETAANRLVTQPIRSGQQVYARGGDLIVLASVSPGAEVLADGNIHIYGALNGRALAGVQGDTGARIFCRRLNAELIAIAGRYQVSEHIDEAQRGGEVQIWLQDDALCIGPLVS